MKTDILITKTNPTRIHQYDELLTTLFHIITSPQTIEPVNQEIQERINFIN